MTLISNKIKSSENYSRVDECLLLISKYKNNLDSDEFDEKLTPILDQFTPEDARLLGKIWKTLDEILETLEILHDHETMKALAEAEEDIKEGRLYDYDEMLKEIRMQMT
ncbi:MAG: hypothetical protein ACE5J3_06235 [Methanosarcinales archaeon]